MAQDNTAKSEEDGGQQSLLGLPCGVRGPDAAVRRGQLLEVRYLWTPALLNADRHATPPLYGFVRLKDVNHRLSGWFPVDDIELKESKGGGGGAAVGTVSPPPSGANRIRGPVLSSVYREITVGMIRTRRGEKQLDFFEERLLRDCRTPTTIRYFVYLCTFAFAPWYYAPYGIFNSEFDPLASNSLTDSERARLRLPADFKEHNPFVRDAYLCPFSLRIYSTFEQMQHETRNYRAGRLRPPGLEIYRDEARGFSMFEVNGSRQVTYCRHLFLLGKSFLENKLAGHDVHNYYFYVVCLHQRHFPQYTDEAAAMYFVGYFTWEKQVADNNLACIVTLPCFAGGAAPSPAHGGTARRAPLGHFGQFMIAASYELAYRRKHVGSPERPLSDLGASAYDRYWRRVLVAWMHSLLPDDAAVVIADDDDDDDDEDDDDEDDGGDSEQSVTVEATTAPAGRGLKRSRAGSSEQNGGAEGDGEGRGMQTETLRATSVRGIARLVRLEEADVLRTLLGMGLLHLNAEDRSLRLVIPVAFVRREFDRARGWAKDVARAEFDAALLTTNRAGAAWATASPSPRQQRQQSSDAAR
ncbi:histone acetyltransferase [Trypanosoma conorhini]|uniref:Histone acetyltransferase n=1 Tax=Trypanosoma conorhini TaxID=83891 RepID=A0A422P6P6_9TRYP|nr:histone acetyltransferase [Trypanosoma conorhini]RNF13365.1 histone acetyltransferase [Trypanosoma conorhini]